MAARRGPDARLRSVPDDSHPALQRVRDAALRKGVRVDIQVFPDSTHTAADAAAAVGAELGQIVKSLVFVAPTETRLEAIVALVSGSNRVDIGLLSAVVSLSSLRRATAQEATEATGFTIGGIPPFAHKRPLRVVMDPDLGRFPVVWAAAGTPNAVFAVPPGTLRSLANAIVAPIAETAERSADRHPGTQRPRADGAQTRA